MKPRPNRFIYLAVAAVALVIGVVAGFAAHSMTSSKSASPAAVPRDVAHTTSIASTSSTNSLTRIYAEDAPGVVTVSVTGKEAPSDSGFPPGVPGQQKFEAIGTGFEVDSNGNIITAEHVVDGASTIKVTFQDGTTTQATLVGSDSSTDSAVIHVDVPASKLHPLTLGSSSSVQPGQAVVAIGTPLSPSYSES